MEYKLCDKYGFNITQRKLRVAMMGLSNNDHILIETLHHKIIQPFAEQIVADFYKVLLSFPEIKAFMERHAKIERLKVTQVLHLKTYGINFSSPEYFEERLQVGRVHAQIGLPISYYEMAFRILNETLLDYMFKHISMNGSKYLEMIKLILNVTALDMSLAIEIYHNKKVNEMTNSIDALIDERQLLSSKVDLDELTQVASRARVLDCLYSNLKKSKNHSSCFSIAMIDLDHFKSVNDKHGHLGGDHVLKSVAQRMKSVLRNDDVLGRYGGEEFLLILPGADLNTANQVAERVCNCVSVEPFNYKDYAIPITVSVGLAVWHLDDSGESLLGRADRALYQAKHQGRNQVVLEFRPDK